MRIVAGRWRGRVIRAPRDARVRPTSDKVREAWMSIVSAALPEARVLDLFAGSGALGLEALSRGATSADFVELAAPSLRSLRENVAALGAEHVAVHRGDALRFVERLVPDAYDVCFADPPYRLGLAERVVARWTEVPFARLLCVEHETGAALPLAGDTRRYGGTSLTLFRSPSHG